MNLFDYLKRNADEIPNRIALIVDGESATYAELYCRIERCAAHLETLGVTNGFTVSLIVDESMDFIANYYAITRLGAIVHPLSGSFTSFELQSIFGSLRPGIIIAGRSNQKRVRDAVQLIAQQAENYRPKIFEVEIPGSAKNRVTAPIPRENDDMAIYMSSGTTSTPKFILHTHRQLTTSAQLFKENYALGNKDKMMFAVPLTNFYGGVCLLGGGIIGQTTLIIGSKFKVHSFMGNIDNHQVTVFAGVPTHFNYLVNYIAQSPAEQSDYMLRIAVSGGSHINKNVFDLFHKQFKVKISNHYGCTEVGFISGAKQEDPSATHCVGRLPSQYKAIIVDGQGNPLQTENEGQLILKGDHITTRYIVDGNCISSLKDGWIHTGDLAKIDSMGYLHVLGRARDIIICGGLNINPVEVEEVIRLHPNVKECSVFGKWDLLLGEVAAAAIVPIQSQNALEEELRILCREKLAPYKHPQQYLHMDFLPKTALGKVKKPELIDRIAGMAP